MKQLLSSTIPFRRTALLFAATLLLASCGGSIPAQPNPTPTTMPTPTNPSQPMDDVRGPLPIPTADSAGPTPTIIGPIVGTSVAGGPVEGPPLTSIVTPRRHPLLLPGPSAGGLPKPTDVPRAPLRSVGDV